MEVKVITDDFPNWEDELRGAIQQSRCVLCLYSNEDSLKKVIPLADSIGVSVGAKALESVALLIAETNAKAKIVIAYENDEHAVSRAASALQPAGLILAPTVVDRICVSRDIASDSVTVRAEEYARITALVQTKHIPSLPPMFLDVRRTDVRVVSDRYDFDYERAKKRRLVNSMHAAAAALVQVALAESGTKPETANDMLLGLIANNMDIYSQLVDLKELMILSVLGSLPTERLRSGDVQKIIEELNRYGDHSLERILSGTDAPSRVLQTTSEALANKYRTLFVDVPTLVERALRVETVAAALPMPAKVVKARLGLLDTAFARLFSAAA